MSVCLKSTSDLRLNGGFDLNLLVHVIGKLSLAGPALVQLVVWLKALYEGCPRNLTAGAKIRQEYVRKKCHLVS